MTDQSVVLSNISQWLIELESGKHKQGKGYLLKDGAYCCLGVAADIVLKLDKEGDEYGHLSYFKGSSMKPECSVLPDAQDIGLMAESGEGSIFAASLAELNDYNGKSFPEIAAIIREDLATNKYGYFFDWVYPAWQEMNKDGH